jgi:hypothetical protein
MAADSTDSDYFNDIGAFDLVNPNKNDRQLIEEFIHDRDSSRDEEENHYVSPENFE